MKTEELEKLEDFLNNSYAYFLTEEDEAKRAYYRGKVMGVDFALDVLGYTIKDDGTKVYLLNCGKIIEHFKVVKKPRKNRERRKRRG